MVRTTIFIGLVATAAAACTSTVTLRDVQRLSRNQDAEGLVDAWRSGAPLSVQPVLMTALAKSEGEESRAIVMETASSHPQEAVRRSAVEGLGAYQDDASTGLLIDALADRFPSVRAQAKATLSQQLEPAFESLQTAVRAHSSPLVRAAGVDLLMTTALRSKDKVATVAAALVQRSKRDDAPQVRLAAVRGLGVLNRTGSRSLLTELMRTDDDSRVRAAAGRALSKLDPVAAEDQTILLVLPLQNATNERQLDRFGDQMADVLTAAVAEAQVCEVVDPTQRDAAIAELKKSGSMLYDGDRPNAPRIGEFAQADQLAYGSLQRSGLIYTIVLKRMDVSTLKLVPGASVTVRGYRADLGRLQLDAVEQF
ncbi:MAG: HEAT repeat domain-containing protein, partial [Myxococcota bacterium]